MKEQRVNKKRRISISSGGEVGSGGGPPKVSKGMKVKKKGTKKQDS